MDSITAAVFNVVFTSLPILLFSILDRPVKNLRALIRYPKVRSGAVCGCAGGAQSRSVRQLGGLVGQSITQGAHTSYSIVTPCAAVRQAQLAVADHDVLLEDGRAAWGGEWCQLVGTCVCEACR